MRVILTLIFAPAFLWLLCKVVRCYIELFLQRSLFVYTMSFDIEKVYDSYNSNEMSGLALLFQYILLGRMDSEKS